MFVSDEMFSIFNRELSVDYEKKSDLKILSVPNGFIHPLELSETLEAENFEYGGVTDEALNFIDISLTKRVSPIGMGLDFNQWYQGANPAINISGVPYVDETVIFLGAIPKHYGHFILEGLSRLWACLDSDRKKLRCVFISSDGPDLFNECFELFGIDKGLLNKITQPTQFREIIIPEPSIRLHDYFHIKYKETVDRIKEAVPAGDCKNVYFSKFKRKNSRAIGEPSIEDVFKKNGFKIFYPEQMTMIETISTLKGCDQFVATSGTNIHNSIFMNDRKKIICLNRSAHFHPIQIMIDRMRFFDAIYIDAFLSPEPQNFSAGPFILGPTIYAINFFESQHYRFNRSKLFVMGVIYWLMYLTQPTRASIFKYFYSIYVSMRNSRWKVLRVASSGIHNISKLRRLFC